MTVKLWGVDRLHLLTSLKILYDKGHHYYLLQSYSSNLADKCYKTSFYNTFRGEELGQITTQPLLKFKPKIMVTS